MERLKITALDYSCSFVLYKVLDGQGPVSFCNKRELPVGTEQQRQEVVALTWVGEVGRVLSISGGERRLNSSEEGQAVKDRAEFASWIFPTNHFSLSLFPLAASSYKVLCSSF